MKKSKLKAEAGILGPDDLVVSSDGITTLRELLELRMKDTETISHEEVKRRIKVRFAKQSEKAKRKA